MYFLAIFPALVWIGAYMFRRRWVGVVIVVGGLGAALGATRLLAMIAPIGAGEGPTMFHLLAYAYCGVVTAVGLMIVCQARVSFAGRCHRCAYDLRGNESGICPECGTEVEVTAGDGGSPLRRGSMGRGAI